MNDFYFASIPKSEMGTSFTGNNLKLCRCNIFVSTVLVKNYRRLNDMYKYYVLSQNSVIIMNQDLSKKLKYGPVFYFK